ncbi:MAG: hypothetical protein NC489_29000 [Ruminococcus flavefaciens]|nr:hypothetical protein [Ruminococcus flavefaciens]
MSNMINPCIWCYQRYGKEYSEHCNDSCEFAKAVKENKLLKEEMDRPIKSLEELTTQFCCLTECKNCPVMIHEYDKRTKHEKENLHIPCCDNLYKWIVKQAQGDK